MTYASMYTDLVAILLFHDSRRFISISGNHVPGFSRDI